MTFVIENHHYYAWCRDCPYTGPLRFKRELAAADAARHVNDKHDGETGPLFKTPHDDEIER
jgi:hypothetical protein